MTSLAKTGTLLHIYDADTIYKKSNRLSSGFSCLTDLPVFGLEPGPVFGLEPGLESGISQTRRM